MRALKRPQKRLKSSPTRRERVVTRVELELSRRRRAERRILYGASSVVCCSRRRGAHRQARDDETTRLHTRSKYYSTNGHYHLTKYNFTPGGDEGSTHARTHLRFTLGRKGRRDRSAARCSLVCAHRATIVPRASRRTLSRRIIRRTDCWSSALGWSPSHAGI